MAAGRSCDNCWSGSPAKSGGFLWLCGDKSGAAFIPFAIVC